MKFGTDVFFQAPKRLESPRGRKKTTYATSTPEMKKMKLGEKQQQEKRQKSAKKAPKELFQKEISQDDLSSEEDEIKLDDSADESSSSDVYTQMIV